MSIQARIKMGPAGWRAGLVGLLPVVVLLAACTASAAPAPATTLATPVAPDKLATLPPAKPAASSAAAAGPVVNVENFNFVPADLTVSAGSTVTWVNHDDAPHTVTSSDKAFSSPSIDTDGQFSFTFSAPGTYSYFCAIHPFMTAKVIVK